MKDHRSANTMKLSTLRDRPEPARQFEEIFKEHHSKEGKEAIKYINNRKSREENIKLDTGI